MVILAQAVFGVDLSVSRVYQTEEWFFGSILQQENQFWLNSDKKFGVGLNHFLSDFNQFFDLFVHNPNELKPSIISI